MKLLCRNAYIEINCHFLSVLRTNKCHFCALVRDILSLSLYSPFFLRMGHDPRLLAGNAIAVDYVLQYTSASSDTSAVKNVLTASVTSGEFTSTLQAQAVKYNAETMSTVKSGSLAVVAESSTIVSVDQIPTMSPSSKDHPRSQRMLTSPGVLAAVIIST